MRPQWSDNILCEVWLIGVPDEANGNYLRRVHEDPSDPYPLATVALEKKRHKKMTQVSPKSNSAQLPSTFQHWPVSKSRHQKANQTAHKKKVYSTNKRSDQRLMNSFCRKLEHFYTLLLKTLTGQLRRSPIVLAACNSSPKDSSLRWSICWLKKRERVEALSAEQGCKRKRDRQRQIKIKDCGQRKTVACEMPA